ncbi:MAG: ATP-binding cassette domain-containing protein [Ruminococcaceae bacterium]|nr:ATP-binding cassette domain-containing protein [Oscillospiraceae bacterium]
MLTVHDLSKAYDAPVLEGFNYEFPEKGLVLIRGASGCGKTTLLRILSGLEKPDGGEILSERELKISCVFQEARLSPHLTALENVLLVRSKKDKKRARECLAQLGMENDAGKYPDELSGGMRLRVSIARSLYYGGDLYLWDEPTKELDPENRKKVTRIIQSLAENACVVVVTHDPELCSEREILL